VRRTTTKRECTLTLHLLRTAANAAVIAGFCLGFSASGASAEGVGQKIQRGHASWYKHGRRTANGEAFNPNGMTAAHRSLPFGTRVRVVNEKTGRSVVVRINDRGPFIGGRIIDLAQGAARQLGMDGVATVSIYRLS
jgi:rare lipoprotein A